MVLFGILHWHVSGFKEKEIMQLEKQYRIRFFVYLFTTRPQFQTSKETHNVITNKTERDRTLDALSLSLSSSLSF